MDLTFDERELAFRDELRASASRARYSSVATTSIATI